MKNTYAKIIVFCIALFNAASLSATYAIVTNFTKNAILVKYTESSGPILEARLLPNEHLEIHSGTNIQILGIDSDDNLVVSEYGKEGLRNTSKRRIRWIPVGWVLGFSICTEDPSLPINAQKTCPVPWR